MGLCQASLPPSSPIRKNSCRISSVSSSQDIRQSFVPHAKRCESAFPPRPNSLTTNTISLSLVSGRQSALRTASSLSQLPPMESACASSAASLPDPASPARLRQTDAICSSSERRGSSAARGSDAPHGGGRPSEDAAAGKRLRKAYHPFSVSEAAAAGQTAKDLTLESKAKARPKFTRHGGPAVAQRLLVRPSYGYLYANKKDSLTVSRLSFFSLAVAACARLMGSAPFGVDLIFLKPWSADHTQ